MTTSTTRVAATRARQSALGLKRLELVCHPDDAAPTKGWTPHPTQGAPIMKTKMKARVAIYWVVDGSSGTTVLDNATKAEALAYFNASFAPYGYKLISIEILL